METGTGPCDTEYQRVQQLASMKKRKTGILGGIRNMEQRVALMESEGVTPIAMMDLLEAIISRCGGEKKLSFLDVSSNYIKLASRVPLTALLFPFLPESEDNPRFHTTVTKILMKAKCVTGVRTMPSGDNTVVMVSFR